MKIGIVSDTHGLLRPEVIQALEGCEAILHGRDINKQEIINQNGRGCGTTSMTRGSKYPQMAYEHGILRLKPFYNNEQLAMIDEAEEKRSENYSAFRQ